MSNDSKPQNSGHQSSKLTRVILIIFVILALGLIFYFIFLSQTSKESFLLPETKTPSDTSENFLEEMSQGEIGELKIESLEGKTLEEMNAEELERAKQEVLETINPQALTQSFQPPGTSLPEIINNTSGVILSVGADYIIIKGNGSNFEDQLPRELKIKISNETTVFEKEQVKGYQGFEGLKYLFPGETVAIESLDNIRGKTEFEATYINKI